MVRPRPLSSKAISDSLSISLTRGISNAADSSSVTGALADFDKQIELNPEHASAHAGRGTTYFFKGDYKRAIASYTEAIRLRPDFTLAYKNRANVYEKIGDKVKAKADRDKVAELEKAAP